MLVLLCRFMQKTPLGYTNFKETSEIRACPHFNSRQHENEAENKTGLKHAKFSKINTDLKMWLFKNKILSQCLVLIALIPCHGNGYHS